MPPAVAIALRAPDYLPIPRTQANRGEHARSQAVGGRPRRQLAAALETPVLFHRATGTLLLSHRRTVT